MYTLPLRSVVTTCLIFILTQENWYRNSKDVCQIHAELMLYLYDEGKSIVLYCIVR